MLSNQGVDLTADFSVHQKTCRGLAVGGQWLGLTAGRGASFLPPEVIFASCDPLSMLLELGWNWENAEPIVLLLPLR